MSGRCTSTFRDVSAASSSIFARGRVADVCLICVSDDLSRARAVKPGIGYVL